MKYEHIKKSKLSREQIAKAFGFKNRKSFNSTSANKRYMTGLNECLRMAEENKVSFREMLNTKLEKNLKKKGIELFDFNPYGKVTVTKEHLPDIDDFLRSEEISNGKLSKIINSNIKLNKE